MVEREGRQAHPPMGELDELDELDEDVLQQIEREVAIFARRMEHARVTRDAVTRLDRSAYLLLMTLQRRGDATIGTLADRFQLDISTVSRQIAPLIEAGLMVRQKMPSDKRVSVLHITEAGLQELQAVRNARKQMYDELLEDWTNEEKSQFVQLLSRLNQRIRSRQAQDQHDR